MIGQEGGGGGGWWRSLSGFIVLMALLMPIKPIEAGKFISVAIIVSLPCPLARKS